MICPAHVTQDQDWRRRLVAAIANAKPTRACTLTGPFLPGSRQEHPVSVSPGPVPGLPPVVPPPLPPVPLPVPLPVVVPVAPVAPPALVVEPIDPALPVDVVPPALVPPEPVDPPVPTPPPLPSGERASLASALTKTSLTASRCAPESTIAPPSAAPAQGCVIRHVLNIVRNRGSGFVPTCSTTESLR